MKLELHFQEFKKMVLLIERIAGKHMTLPVLSCLYFDIKKNQLNIKATNLDVGAEVYLSAKSDGEEVFAIPAITLSSFLGQVGDYDGIVYLESSSGNIQITTAKSKCVIKTVPHEDFPDIPKVSGEQTVVLPPETIVKGLRAVWYSASTSMVKPEFASVYVYSQNENLVFAATDSFRLAEKKVRLPAKVTISDILIPFKNVADITRVLESSHEDVNIMISKNLISFEIPHKVCIVSRAIDGVFPDYKQIIPKSFTTEIVALKQDVLNALKISNVFSDKFNQVKFIIDLESKIFEIRTKNSDVGENKTIVDATITGEKIDVNFNYKYIVDCFQSIDSDSISLQLSGSNKAMIITPVSGDKSFMYLVMPMNR
ncbi:MAG: DNA polymerase III subunit beta [Candidatus Taylorbacteria bacterium]|nr:DNA polymerase III subunit beta [Candidatus Taylorbacteria bacterium]